MSVKSPIKKLFHFIWVGGKLREAHKRYLQCWRKINPHYDYWLWYDSEHMIAYDLGKAIKTSCLTEFTDESKKYPTMKAKQKLEMKQVEASWANRAKRQEMYTNLTGNAGIHQETTNLKTIRRLCPHGVKLMDVRAHMQTMSNKFLYEMEMVNRGGNFGAASDILRIELLRKYGGFYCDIDLLPKKALGDVQSWTTLARVGTWDHKISNAFLGSHPKSDFMNKVSAKMAQSYKTIAMNGTVTSKSSSGNFNFYTDINDYYSDIRNSTIRLTGPTVIRDVARMLAHEFSLELYQNWLTNKKWYVKKSKYKTLHLHPIDEVLNSEILLDESYIDFDTDEQKVHDWLVHRD